MLVVGRKKEVIFLGVRGRPAELFPYEGRISFKVPARDKERIIRAAHSVGLTMSEYIRKVTLAAARIDYKELGLDWAKD